jgi:hypothetical protein
MSETTKLRGICGSCGKVFRVPSAERTYTCKACGGEVSAEPAEAPTTDGPHPVEEEHVPRFGARWQETHPTKSRAWVWISALLVVVLGGGGYIVWAASRPVADIQATTAELVSAWQAADLDLLAGFHHPTRRAEFRKRLQVIADHRGWQSGFPQVGDQSAKVSEGTTEDPDLGLSSLSFDGGWAEFNWQYEPARNCWYIYGFDLAPPPLAPRAEDFRATWGSSSPEAMAPFFREEYRDKWVDLFQRKARQDEWASGWPELAAPRIQGEEELLAAPGTPVQPHKLVCTFALSGGGELVVRWGHDDASDEWLVGGIDFP